MRSAEQLFLMCMFGVCGEFYHSGHVLIFNCVQIYIHGACSYKIVMSNCLVDSSLLIYLTDICQYLAVNRKIYVRKNNIV